MATRTIFLIIYPGQPNQRAHFGVWVPYKEDGVEGTVIHVVGAPMAGFSLEFKRRYRPTETHRLTQLVAIGSVDVQYLHDFEGDMGSDTTPRGGIELVAAQVQPPRASVNFLEPVNDTTNRRCQEWTMDYVRQLVARRYLDEAAVAIVQSKRDAPNVGIALRPAAARGQQQAQ
ncbi:hypothetical protein BDV95DRAFT_604205 [Massariosphaeria phaeospora]|uniref:Uncharacterized protein n=1 Tax=Massariosphaeria phaeospora TaxID=100035 RepID=A0A7C8I9G2_9PLEO|nr:hypothetical protein BDV95DRAFT_604205 [Massariosphaeria phaeospora]